MKPKNFNDLLALIAVIGIIPALWILDGLAIIKLQPQIVGGTMVTWALIFQYYYRRAKRGK